MSISDQIIAMETNDEMSNGVNNSISLTACQTLGLQMIRQYYEIMSHNPQHLHELYSDDSCFVHGVFASDSQPVYGKHEIQKRIQELDFSGCQCRIRQVNSVPTVENGIVIHAAGELSTNHHGSRRFVQSIVLAYVSPGKYYIRNNIFHYQDEAFYTDYDHPQSTPDTNLNNDDPVDNELDQLDTYQTADVTMVPEEENLIIEDKFLTLDLAVRDPTVEDIQEEAEMPLCDTGKHSTSESEPLKSKETKVSDTTTTIIEMLDSMENGSENNQLQNLNYGRADELNVDGLTFSRAESELPLLGDGEEENDFVDSFCDMAAVATSTVPSVRKSYADCCKDAAATVVTAFPDLTRASPSPIGFRPASSGPIIITSPKRSRASMRTKDPQNSSPVPPGSVECRPSKSKISWNSKSGSMDGRRQLSAQNYSDAQQVFVGNVHCSLSTNDIKNVFSVFGEVIDVKIRKPDPKLGNKVPSFAFVVFKNTSSVRAALEKQKVEAIMKDGTYRRLNVEAKKSIVEPGASAKSFLVFSPKVKDAVKVGNSGFLNSRNDNSPVDRETERGLQHGGSECGSSSSDQQWITPHSQSRTKRNYKR